ncbi:MAG: DUF1579 family protein [Gemmatimonadaceae bacterium]|nr:DUF1579 family protein [Gemmatimonadaceae bacterium]
MRLLLSILPFLVAPLMLIAQAAPAATPPQIALFARLVGEWEGEATAVMGPGARHVLRQTERVEAVAGGTAFAVRGTGHERMADGTEQVTFDAFAVIFLDHDHVTPRMRTFTMFGGNWADPDFTIDASGYRWSMRDPRAGLIRYEMSFDTDGRWVETGSVSRDDGKNWTPIFEMKLTRKR